MGDGVAVGTAVGAAVGAGVGALVGAFVGGTVGAGVGPCVGPGVTLGLVLGGCVGSGVDVGVVLVVLATSGVSAPITLVGLVVGMLRLIPSSSSSMVSGVEMEPIPDKAKEITHTNVTTEAAITFLLNAGVLIERTALTIPNTAKGAAIKARKSQKPCDNMMSDIP